jgi:large subunit ribosomal protein L16
MWIRIFPDKPYTKKPADTRMGKGKGEVEGWVASVKSGRVLFEITGLPEAEALNVLRVVTNKLPVRTRILSRESIGTVL